MARRYLTLQVVRFAALALLATGIVATGLLSGFGEHAPEDQLKLKINETVEKLWERSDGSVALKRVDRAWTWGPEPITTSTEVYPDSPSGLRTLVYYDKGRLDILNPDANAGHDWYAVGGLLVAEMLAGQVQLGDSFFVARPTPEIPIAGDFGQAQPVTYATLALHANVWDASEGRAPDRDGQPVTAHLAGDGVLTPGAVESAGVVYREYDAVTGHNVAGVFADWSAAQPYPPLYLLGHPLSEPYWIDTVVDGEPRQMLVQAFERRVLTYSPDNREGWQVESANAGRHYRVWRGLPEITDPALMPLASGQPFGEEIVGAALAYDVDPFMLAAIGSVTSAGDPASLRDNGGRGLLAVHPGVHDLPALEALVDPALNAGHGARALKFWIPAGVEQFDWRAVLANYYAHGEVDWSDPALEGFVQDVLDEYARLRELYPPLEPDLVVHEVWGGRLSAGPAAFYSPSYTPAWWERTQLLYASKGLIAAGYEPDPNGYYCVRPGYIPGERLRLRANGVTITCTVGDMVADHDLYNWLLVSNWAVEMNWDAFTALGLQHYNYVEVDYPGQWAKRPPPIPPPPPAGDAPAEEPAGDAPAADPVDDPVPAPGDAPSYAVPAAPAGPPAIEKPDTEPETVPDPEPEPPAETPPPTT